MSTFTRLLGRRANTNLLATHYAILVLLGAAVLSILLYWYGLVQPYHLVNWQGRNHLDLYRINEVNPQTRWLLIVLMIEQAALYAIAWRAVQETRTRIAWAVVLGGAAAMAASLLYLFPFGADDIFDNIMHGRMLGVYGANPFIQVISQFRHEPLWAYAGWPTTPSAYGPLWEMAAAATALLANSTRVVPNVLAFKLLGGLFWAGSIGFVMAILRRWSPKHSLAGVLAFAWNPAVLYETFGHGHNDIALVFWVLMGTWALTDRRYTLAVLALLAGGLFKFIPVLLIPVAGLLALRDLPDWQSRSRFLVLTTLAALGLVALAYAPFWGGNDILGIGLRSTLFTTSLPTIAFVQLRELWGARRAGSVVSSGAALLAGAFALTMAARAWRDRSQHAFARSALHILLFYLLVCGPWFQNWYAIWPLGLAVLLPPRPGPRLAHILAFASLSKPFIFAPMFLWLKPIPNELWRELRLTHTVMAVPWLYALYAILGRHSAPQTEREGAWSGPQLPAALPVESEESSPN